MNSLSEPMSKRDSTRVHADERQRRQTVVALDYLVRDPPDGPADIIAGKDDVAVNGNGAGQRKTPTPEREGKLSHANTDCGRLSKQALLRSLAASRDRVKG